jgi:hypothetical protein
LPTPVRPAAWTLPPAIREDAAVEIFGRVSELKTPPEVVDHVAPLIGEHYIRESARVAGAEAGAQILEHFGLEA